MKEDTAVKFKKPKPSVSVDASDLPAIKNWVVGKTYEVKAKIKMTFQSEGQEWDSYPMEGSSEKKPEMRARFRIVSITPEKEKKSKMYPRMK